MYENAPSRRIERRCKWGIRAGLRVRGSRGRTRERADADGGDGRVLPDALRGRCILAIAAFYGPRETVWSRFGGSAQVVARLILPVTTLLLSFAAIYLYLDTPATLIVGGADGQWLTAGHLLVPFCFLCIHLTNRRYGPSYAFAQVAIAQALGTAFALYAVPRLAGVVSFKFIPDVRMAAAFGAAFFGASFISIVVFDGSRGPRWWIAPLFGMVSSGALFCLIFYPAAYAGIAPWTHQMLMHMELLMVAGILTLIPYWILRGIVRPLPGFNGY
jgi:uncharacterized PurR-regulated membrane protein YhhQ (DUF165 family)